MSISSSTRKAGPFACNGSTVAFPFAFKVFTTADVRVVLTDSNSVESDLALGTNYTVALNADQDANPGGTVTTTATYATGYKITLTSQVQNLQPVTLTNQGGFYPKIINGALDRVTVLVQQLAEKLGRSLSLPISAPSGTSTQLPFPVANRVIAWNETATGLQSLDPQALATIVAFGTSKAEIFTGDGTTKVFNLSANPGTINNLDVALAGVTLLPGIDYTWAGGLSLTLTNAPANGAKLLARYLQGLPQGVGDAGAISFLQAGAGALTRDTQSKLRETVSVKDFGSVGDNVTNEVPFFTNAKTNGKAVFIPSGTYKFSTAFDSGDLPMVAVGATLNPQVPATTYFRSYIDLGQKAITRQSIRDVTEYSGTPTDYTYINELASFFVKHQNGAGYQQSYASDSGGRTNVPVFRAEVEHFGYGDVNAFDASMSVRRHPSYASATSWTGQNSVTVVGGEAGAATANVNLYGAEFHLSDNANDKVAANGIVLDFARNNGNPSVGGAYNTVWTGVRLQTSGTYAADSGLSINGKWHVGIDFSGATLSNNAAMALKTNDRIYFGTAATSPPIWWASTLPNNYQTFDGTKYNFVVNGVAALTVAQSEVVSTPIHKFIGSFNVVSSGNLASTVGAAGAASALPAAPFTYLKIQIDGVTYKIPVYNN